MAVKDRCQRGYQSQNTCQLTEHSMKIFQCCWLPNSKKTGSWLIITVKDTNAESSSSCLILYCRPRNARNYLHFLAIINFAWLSNRIFKASQHKKWNIEFTCTLTNWVAWIKVTNYPTGLCFITQKIIYTTYIYYATQLQFWFQSRSFSFHNQIFA